MKGRSASRLASPVFHYPGMTDHVLRLIVLRLSAALATLRPPTKKTRHFEQLPGRIGDEFGTYP